MLIHGHHMTVLSPKFSAQQSVQPFGLTKYWAALTRLLTGLGPYCEASTLMHFQYTTDEPVHVEELIFWISDSAGALHKHQWVLQGLTTSVPSTTRRLITTGHPLSLLYSSSIFESIIRPFIEIFSLVVSLIFVFSPHIATSINKIYYTTLLYSTLPYNFWKEVFF